MKQLYSRIKEYLRSLSFRTGAIVALICIVCYAISFGQMLLPIPTVAKGILWFIFFGLAKTCQYTAILILGKAGVERLRNMLKAHRTRS